MSPVNAYIDTKAMASNLPQSSSPFYSCMLSDLAFEVDIDNVLLI